ncbi:hypothetical protein R2B70_11675 [Aeromonas sp. XH]|uniref:hypothetical protein n=1 Tax=Aeromonas sp. XH TaxID=3081770 RepID=UPI002966A29E|nr:hypothetical protein [Aeromonas sp. XH]WOX46890.1 hypothetical protein R2B70_11675 [Aeromonas sp. XH]
MSTSRYLLPLITALLTGCGGELLSTAATTGKLQAEQANQARAQLDQFNEALSAAVDATEAASVSAAPPAQ